MKQHTHHSTPKSVIGRRARKARARIRKQNKQRAHLVRNN